MIIKKNIKQMKADDEVIGFLEKNKIRNLNLLGYIANHADAEAWIYNGDINNGVIVARADGDFFMLDTENREFLTEFWAGLSAGLKRFSGVPENIAEIIFDIAGKPVWSNKCNVFALTGEYGFEPNTEYERLSLTAADAHEVNEYYTYKSENSYFDILESIEKRDSEAIKIDGDLAAWILTHDDNSMGPLFVKEKFRGRRMAKIVSERLAEKLLAKNIIPYGQIVEDNKASHASIKRIKGMELSHACVWFAIMKN